MKEIERYKITSANGNSSNVTKCDDGHWVNYADIVDFIGGTYKTIHNLEKDNYELKDNLKYVTEGNIKLQARIKELESQSHINEIKAQGIEEAISYSQRELMKPKYGTYHWKLLCKQYIEQLRTKHD